jgi:hypothetical protein
MLVKIEHGYDAEIVTPLQISEGRGGLSIVFATANANDYTSIDLSLAQVERAFNDAAKAGEAVVDLTSAGIEKIKQKYAI